MNLKPFTTKAHCNRCARETLHDVLHKKALREDYEDDEGHAYGHGEELFEMVACCGCEEIKLKVTSSGSEFDTYVTYHPGAMARQKPAWVSDLFLNGFSEPLVNNIHELLREIYTGLQNRMPRLIALGVRALIESVMVHKKSDQGSFEQNLQALYVAGHLSAKDKERLLKIIDVGSAVTHRAHAPTDEEVVAMVSIVESLLMSVYISDGLVNTAHKRVPPRPPRVRAQKQ